MRRLRAQALAVLFSVAFLGTLAAPSSGVRAQAHAASVGSGAIPPAQGAPTDAPEEDPGAGEVDSHGAIELDQREEQEAAAQVDEGASAPGVVIRLYWKHGLNYRLEDKLKVFDNDSRLTGRIGLRLQTDASAYASSGIEGAHGGVDIRRFYFYSTGRLELARPILFKLDLGVDGGRFFIEDAYFWLTDLPWVGTAKFGQFKAPMSLSRLVSSNNRPFMEVGSPVEAFSPGSKAGLQFANVAAERRATWAFGVFADTFEVPDGDATQSAARVVGRVTGLPIFEPTGSGSRLLHVGLSSSYVFSSERVQYRARPESYDAPFLVDTGDIDAAGAYVYGTEIAWIDGPLTVSGEWLGALVDSRDYGSVNFNGIYGSGVWALTGEQRPYNRDTGIFGAVEPHDPIDFSAWRSLDNWKKGAWEVALRASWVDLDSKEIRGGRMVSSTLGVNWIWNREVRWLAEYVFANAKGGPQDGNLHTFQVRFQVLI